MSTVAEPILSEFRGEAPSIRRMLERVPTDKLTWKPHEKSRTLGQLAWHVANLPGMAAKIVDADEFVVTGAAGGQGHSTEEIREAFDKNASVFEDRVGKLTDEAAMADWRLMVHGNEIMRRPRVAALRTNVLNHLYHHRGQLSVYLRLLDVPLPMVYGPTADENPFV